MISVRRRWPCTRSRRPPSVTRRPLRLTPWKCTTNRRRLLHLRELPPDELGPEPLPPPLAPVPPPPPLAPVPPLFAPGPPPVPGVDAPQAVIACPERPTPLFWQAKPM